MIRTDLEYRQTLKRIEQSEQTFREEEAALRAKGLDRAKIKHMLEPSRRFYEQIRSEVETYKRFKRGEFGELQHSLGDLGRLLIAARIASGLSQRELAERLGVHESQVSRDERNDYHGITVDRASRILEALGIEVTTAARKAPPILAQT